MAGKFLIVLAMAVLVGCVEHSVSVPMSSDKSIGIPTGTARNIFIAYDKNGEVDSLKSFIAVSDGCNVMYISGAFIDKQGIVHSQLRQLENFQVVNNCNNN